MYTMQRCLVVMIGTALAALAGAQSMPYQSPPDASSYQEAPPAYGNTAPAQNDPPGRVARLSYVNGEVSFTPAGEENWVQAQVNRPVVTGDKLWTNDDAHAELSLGAATVRLDRSSSFDFLNLDDQLAQMELTQGTLNLNVRRLPGNEIYEVDTPTIAFVASRDGDYRINVDPNGGTTVTAWRGSGDAVGEGGRRVTIEEGQAVVFNDSQLSNPLVSQIGARNRSVPRNDFDTFVSEREQRYTQASHQYVSEDVVGYEDLDQYGSWEDAPQYGHVWYPREVAADWAPYHDGHWAWVDPWGWTWVDNAPWGYAPSHYGRWSYVGSRWGWVPGPVNVAPVYAPAFVAFVGGGGVSVGFSVGGPVGWFALGPSDVYFPGYRCGPDYFARVNYSNAYVSHTVVNNYYGGWSNGSLNYSQMHYANRDAPRAMTAMRGDAFVAGRPVAGAAIPVNRETFANARVAPQANLMPTRESLVAGRSRAAAPPAAAINRPVIAANRPAPAAPSFEQRQALLQRNGGQPLTRNQMRTAAAQQPANARVAAANNNVRVVGNNNRGNAVPARAAVDAGANRGNMAGATPATNVRAPTNDGRVTTGQAPNRTAETNRSQERANAQTMRSAGYAHQGAASGERPVTQQQGHANAAARETAQTRAREDTQAREARNVPQQNGSNQGNRGVNTPQNAQRLNSSSFAHGNQNARGSASTTEQRDEANARSNAQQREHTATANAGRENAQARGNAAQQNAREQLNAGDRNSRAQASADANARAQANARASANPRAEANSSASANARADTNAQASANGRAESARQSQAAQSRAQERQRAAAAEQQSSQARAQQQRVPPENRAVAQQQRAQAQEAQQQQQREASMQRSQQQRAQPQVAHSPPQQRSEPVTRSQPQQQVQRAPAQRSEPPAPQPQVAHTPPPQQQKAQPPQHQVARSTPEQRQPAPKKDKDKDKDTNPGGG